MTTKEETDDNKKIEEDNGVSWCLLVPTAIVAVIIGSHYDASTSACGDGGDEKYMIGLQLFLYIGGYIQIGVIAFRGLIVCFNKKCLECVCCTQGLIVIFNMAWAGIGLYMYTQQMSTKCQKEQIGIMILSWSVIQFAAVVLMCFCFAFIAEMKKNGKCNQENAEESAKYDGANLIAEEEAATVTLV